MENFYNKVYVAVEEASQMIKEHDDTCSQDVCGRVYKHFFKVTTTTAQGKSLEECARSFVDRAFRGYASAGGKKDWFYAIDFSPAFACAVWEILAIRCRLVPNLSFQGLSVFVPERSRQTAIQEVWLATLCTKMWWLLFLKHSFQSVHKEPPVVPRASLSKLQCRGSFSDALGG